jgi:hypothetical protein
VLEARHARKIVPGSNGIFLPTVVICGHVVGSWKRVLKKKTTVITISGFKQLTKCEKQAVKTAAGRYGEFIGLPAEIIL